MKLKRQYIDYGIGIILSILLLSNANPITQNITHIKDNVSFILAMLWFLYSSISITLKIKNLLKLYPSKIVSVATTITVIVYGLSFLIPYQEGGDRISNLHVDLSLFATISLALICISLLSNFSAHLTVIVPLVSVAFTASVFVVIVSGGINTISELMFYFTCNILLYYLYRLSIDNINKH